jgi:hypothetical protein
MLLDIEGVARPVHGAYALEITEEIPSGLSELYNHMMTRIERGKRKDPQYCKDVLVATSLAFRALLLSELGVLSDRDYLL